MGEASVTTASSGLARGDAREAERTRELRRARGHRPETRMGSGWARDRGRHAAMRDDV